MYLKFWTVREMSLFLYSAFYHKGRKNSWPVLPCHLCSYDSLLNENRMLVGQMPTETQTAIFFLNYLPNGHHIITY